MRKVFSLVLFLFIATSAHAACTGSGTTWSCPAGASASDVQNAINSASDGATITFATGSYSWSSFISFSTTKGVTLLCNGVCNLTTNGTVLGIQNFSGTLTQLYRFSGFNVTTTNTGQGIFWFDACLNCRGQINQIRVDHNTFTVNSGSNGTIIFAGDTQSVGYYYGVIDHNTVIASGPHPVALYFPIGDYDNSPPVTSHFGTANNMFLEDNVLTVATNNDVSSPCFTDAWGFAPLVIRHNTVTNCLEVVHDLGHAGGPSNVEVYNNKFIQTSGIAGQGADDGYRMFHHQGAQEEIFWNNSFTPLSGQSGDTISVTANYVDSYCSSYPCLGNGSHGPQPGRDSAGVLKPIYVWGNFNTINGNLVVGGNESSGTYVAENRDLYNAVSANAQTSPTSPFNGTVGVGFGTLANRPTTCTHSNSASPTRSQDDGHGGVGYAVQSVVGTIGASTGAGTASDVVLYSCTATNTWTQIYKPYTYPHPLTTGTTGTSQPPPTPSNLNANVQ